MQNEFYGETEISPQELFKYSKHRRGPQSLIANLFVFLPIRFAGAAGVLAFLVYVVWVGIFVITTIVILDILKSQSGIRSMIPTFDTLGKVQSIWMGALYIFFFASFVLALIRLIHVIFIKPLLKTIFYRTNAKMNAIANADAGTINYKIDHYGLEYDIRSSKARNRYKLYWRNFSDAEYSPDIIRFYKGKKQTAFVLMRAFPGKERQVGQFIETAMNKMKERKQTTAKIR